MEPFKDARSVRLRSHLGTYLCALDDEAVSHGYRRGMVWAVELAELRVPSGPERPLPRLQRDTHRRPDRKSVV